MGSVRTIRPARVEDVPAICEIINHYAERGRMLHRGLQSVYEALREFQVAESDNGRLLGCAAVDVFWGDLAEVKSLAVDPQDCNQGVGELLLNAAVEDARRLGIKKLFALTYEADFFANRGFEKIDRQSLPEKVWSECVACPKAEACDEIAMMLLL